MSEDENTYAVTRYQSGTTWIHHKDYHAGLHIGYFDLKKADTEIIHPCRGDLEKNKFVNDLCDMLNLIASDSDKDYWRSFMSCGAIDIRQTMVIFTDALLGKIEVKCFIVNNGWHEANIPSEISEHLRLSFLKNTEFLAMD